jgi:hypothetical protein
METLIKNLRNNRKVIFGQGKFDQWCVFVVESDGYRMAPHDITYFTEFKRIDKCYSDNKIYKDFVYIYNKTNGKVDESVLSLIDEIVDTYKEEDKVIIEQWFSVIYAGMIAEENKEGARLKKRIKRLGMHQVLILNMSPDDAANFSKGRKWRDLDAIMRDYGF